MQDPQKTWQGMEWKKCVCHLDPKAQTLSYFTKKAGGADGDDAVARHHDDRGDHLAEDGLRRNVAVADGGDLRTARR